MSPKGILREPNGTSPLYVENIMFYAEISRRALAHGSPVFSRNNRVLAHGG